MATQMTQTVALSTAAQFIAAYAEGRGATLEPATAAEVAAVLAHMAEVKAKPRAKTEGMTKQQMAALALAKQVAVFVRAQSEGVTSKQVVEGCGLPEVGSTQKAAHLLKLCAQHGWLTRVEVKSKVLWVAGDTPVA